MNKLPRVSRRSRTVFLSSFFEYWKNTSYYPLNSGVKGKNYLKHSHYMGFFSNKLPSRLLLNSGVSANLFNSGFSLFNIFSLNPKYNSFSSYFIDLNSVALWSSVKKFVKGFGLPGVFPGTFNNSSALSFLVNFSTNKRK